MKYHLVNLLCSHADDVACHTTIAKVNEKVAIRLTDLRTAVIFSIPTTINDIVGVSSCGWCSYKSKRVSSIH